MQASWQAVCNAAVCATNASAPPSSMHAPCTRHAHGNMQLHDSAHHAACGAAAACRIVLHQLCAHARTSSAVSIMSIRLSTPQPPSGSISFSLAKTGRARETAATLPRATVDGAEKAREEEARESMSMVGAGITGSVGISRFVEV